MSEKSLVLKYFSHYAGVLRDAKDNMVNKLKELSLKVALNENYVTEIFEKVPSNPYDQNYFSDIIYGVTTTGAAISNGVDSTRIVPFQELHLETLLSLIKSLEYTIAEIHD